MFVHLKHCRTPAINLAITVGPSGAESTQANSLYKGLNPQTMIQPKEMEGNDLPEENLYAEISDKEPDVEDYLELIQITNKMKTNDIPDNNVYDDVILVHVEPDVADYLEPIQITNKMETNDLPVKYLYDDVILCDREPDVEDYLEPVQMTSSV